MIAKIKYDIALANAKGIIPPPMPMSKVEELINHYERAFQEIRTVLNGVPSYDCDGCHAIDIILMGMEEKNGTDGK